MPEKLDGIIEKLTAIINLQLPKYGFIKFGRFIIFKKKKRTTKQQQNIKQNTTRTAAQ